MNPDPISRAEGDVKSVLLLLTPEEDRWGKSTLMATCCRRERKLKDRIRIARMQSLVRRLGAMNAGAEAIAFHRPALAPVFAAMKRMDAIGLGRGEAAIVRAPGQGT